MLKELKNIKVKDVILIYRFHEMMKASSKNVKKFKKFTKEK